VEGNFKDERTTFHPQSRFGKGLAAFGGRWNVVLKKLLLYFMRRNVAEKLKKQSLYGNFSVTFPSKRL
jgi:hypothetical protein